jgi:dihydrofolate reductase
MQFADDTPAATPVPASATPRLAIIVAVAANGVIGADNRLPWRLPEDLKRFRALTTGHAIIMGRKTWESLPHALPGRQNIVVTGQAGYLAAGAEIASSLDDALARVRLPAPAFCIGGGQLYRDAMPRADELHVTEIASHFAGDASFAPIDLLRWREIDRLPGTQQAVAGFAYAFVTYLRTRHD